MNSNVITKNDEMVNMTDSAYGAISTHIPFTPRLCGGEPKVYEASHLVRVKFKQISYAITQSFPEDQLSAALDGTMTEIPQITAKASLFNFNRYPEGVEFIFSEMDGMKAQDIAEINGETLKELLKKWDYNSYHGKWAGNENDGFVSNAKASTVYAGAGTNSYSGLVAAIGANLREMRDIFSLQSTDIQIALPSKVDSLLDGVNSQTGTSLRDEIEATYRGVSFISLPSFLDSEDVQFTMTALPYVRFYRGAIPAIYSTAPGDAHGLSTSELFTLESAAVECKKAGAIRKIRLEAQA